MATVYYHAQIGVVTDEGDVNVIYPLNMAEDVNIEPNVSAPNITNLQALINALGSYAFKNTIIDDTSTTSTTETWSASKINSQILNGIGEHLTEDEYNALSPAEKNAGTFFVDDVNAEPVLIDQRLDATSANPVANAPVATAINSINSDLTELGDKVYGRDYIEVTGNGVKKYNQMLAEIFALIDPSKINKDTVFEIDGGTTKETYHLQGEWTTTQYGFTSQTVSSSAARFDTIFVASTGNWFRLNYSGSWSISNQGVNTSSLTVTFRIVY